MLSVNVHGWEFCMKPSGRILSRNAEKAPEWKERDFREAELPSDSHYNVIRQALVNMVNCFPGKITPLPSSADESAERVEVESGVY